jgi:hypothetical protein
MSNITFGKAVTLLDKDYRPFYEDGDNTGVVMSYSNGWYSVAPIRNPSVVLKFRHNKLKSKH